MAELNENPSQNKTSENGGHFKELIGFWILGFCTYFGYIVILSAAHDIINEFHPYHENEETINERNNSRKCNEQSTGTILLADILPSLIAKMLSQFLPFWVVSRMWIATWLPVLGFLLVSLAKENWEAYAGVIFVSFSSGLAEATFLSYTSFFMGNVLSTWSSGTGAACLLAAAYYAILTIFMEPWITILTCLWVPALQIITFYFTIRHPNGDLEGLALKQKLNNPNMTLVDDVELTTFKQKLKFAVTILLPKYMLPLILIFLLEYFINQGLYELIVFDNIFIDGNAQYRLFNLSYQFAVFMSRSSINFIQVKKTYFFVLFQFINAIFFLVEAILYFTPHIWLVIVIILWEGALGGMTYVNTYYNMSQDISPVIRVFSIGVVNQADSFGISIAGIIAVPVHSAICKLPRPHR